MGSATGPRSPRGKSRSSQNAAKHWIESGRILPPEQDEARILHRGLVEDFRPNGLAENEIVNDVVFNRLNRRRIDVAFTREFSKADTTKLLRWIENHESTAIDYWLRSDVSQYKNPDNPSARLRPDLCIKALEGVQTRIKERGPGPDDLRTVRSIYGSEPTEDGALLMVELARMPIPGFSKSEDLEECTKEILDTLEEEIGRQKDLLRIREVLDNIEFDSGIREPAAPALETLLRYRASNTRELKDLLDSLERIRRLRRTAE
jgi:hypothetical protein